MTRTTYEEDLVVLVADWNTKAAVQSMLDRHEALGIRPISYSIFVHTERDPGCFKKAPAFLRAQLRRFERALVMFDREGCGSDNAREDIERDVTDRLAQDGWNDRADSVVLDPELEVWVWSDSPHVAEILGWRNHTPPLRQWLEEQEFTATGSVKPIRPKEAMEQALYIVRRPRSSQYYAKLGQAVSLQRCQDAAFLKFKQVLQSWFPQAVT